MRSNAHLCMHRMAHPSPSKFLESPYAPCKAPWMSGTPEQVWGKKDKCSGALQVARGFSRKFLPTPSHQISRGLSVLHISVWTFRSEGAFSGLLLKAHCGKSQFGRKIWIEVWRTPMGLNNGYVTFLEPQPVSQPNSKLCAISSYTEFLFKRLGGMLPQLPRGWGQVLRVL